MNKENSDFEARLGFTGDIMCQHTLNAVCRGDFSNLLVPVRSTLASVDFLTGNLETTCAGTEAGFSDRIYSFNTPDSFVFMLKEFGFDFVSTANNHCLDRGIAGLYRTLEVLDKAGVSHTGTARSEAERKLPNIQEINGIRIAFIAYTYGTNAFANHEFLKPEESFAVNLLQPQETLPGAIDLLYSEKVESQLKLAGSTIFDTPQLRLLRSDIAAARAAGADFIVVLMHCGGQYNLQPDPYTEFMTDEIIRFGADMIVGNHSHVIHRYAIKNGIPVFYSLGNFLNTPRSTPGNTACPFSDISLILKTILRKEQGRTIFAGGSFTVTKSILRPNGETVVENLYELIQNEMDAEKKKALATDYYSAVRTFLNLPENAEISIQAEIPLP